MKNWLAFLFLAALSGLVHPPLFAGKLFIPMNAQDQTNHLKAYGIAFLALQAGLTVDWLLNYDGGAFVIEENKELQKTCQLRGITVQLLPDAQYAGILQQIANPDYNGEIIKLEKAPRVAVYTPPSKLPWDDAVTMALTYAEIPYDKIYDEDLLQNRLHEYDWLHLHHEDFTGQFGKFWAAYRNANWYVEDVNMQQQLASKLGFKKVSQLKLAVAKKIQEFVSGGGYLFAMCSATDSYDIALAAAGIDICSEPFDGDPADPTAQEQLNYESCFAFKDFTLVRNPMEYEYADIDNTMRRRVPMLTDYFTLFTFSAKFDPVPTMLCQNHTTTIKGFMGQTTAFRKEVLKSNVLVMGENKSANEARYIHGEYGNGTWTFYGGHDPEDYQHQIGDPPTDLSLHPNSPGYRLILNNVLFPAAKKMPKKT